MNSNDIKKTLKKKFGLTVRCTSTPTKNPCFTACIRPEPSLRHTDPLIYKSKFPEAFAQICLGVVYGPGKMEGAYAGNVMPNRISLSACKWDAAFAAYDEQTRVSPVSGTVLTTSAI